MQDSWKTLLEQVYCCEFLHRPFIMYLKNFVKHTRTCFIIAVKGILKRNVFHPVVKYSYRNYCPSYAVIPPWTSEIRPRWVGMKKVTVSCKWNSKFTKKSLYRLISVIDLPPLVYSLVSRISSLWVSFSESLSMSLLRILILSICLSFFLFLFFCFIIYL